MHYKHYKHMHVPDSWEQYWSKYPNGYTVLEALMDWLGQVNEMTDSFNQLSDDYTVLNRNMNALEKELRMSWNAYKESTTNTYTDFRDEVYTIINNWIATIEPTIQDEVVKKLNNWLDDGTLADIINNDVFNMKANQTDLNVVTAQLQQTGGIHLSFAPFKINNNEEITDTINNAIEHAYINKIPKVVIPEGHYYVDVVKGIRMKDNVDIVFEGNNTVIEALATEQGDYAMFKVWNVSNVSFYGKATLIGERYEHTGTTREHGYGMDIKGSNDIFIEHIVAKDFWGDGMFIGSNQETWGDGTEHPYNPVSHNIHINYFEADNNRRQGISVLSVIDLYAKKLVLKNTNGTAPSAGIDFEPESVYEHLTNIVIDELITEGNAGSGMQIHIMNWGKTTHHYVSILIRKHIDRSTNKGMAYYSNGSEYVKGYITINNAEYNNTRVEIVDHPAESLKITFKEPVVLCDGTFLPYLFEKSETVGYRPYIMGNIEFIKPQVIYTTEQEQPFEMIFRNGDLNAKEPTSLYGLKNVSIINPLSGVKSIQVSSKTENLTLVDEYNSLHSRHLTDNFVQDPYSTKLVYERVQGESEVRYTFNKNLTGRTMTFINNTNNGFYLIPHTGHGFYPKLTGDEEVQSALYSNKKGDRIVISHLENGDLYIKEMVGSWRFVS